MAQEPGTVYTEDGRYFYVCLEDQGPTEVANLFNLDTAIFMYLFNL